MPRFLKAAVLIAAVSVLPAFAQDPNSQSVRPPSAIELSKAVEEFNLPGSCIVTTDVDKEGKPTNTQAECDPNLYEPAAIRAVSAARFAPKIVDGEPVVRTGVKYPFELRVPEASVDTRTESSESIGIADRDAQPIKPPDSSLLADAIGRYNRDGDCVVTMDVDEEGVPVNIEADCTPRYYEAAAKKAIVKARFAPKFVDGKPAPRTGVVYPFSLRKSGSQNNRDVPSCSKRRTSNRSLKLFRALDGAVLSRDHIEATNLISKLEDKPLYCKQEALLMLQKARSSSRQGEFTQTMHLLKELDAFLQNGHSASSYVLGTKELLKQWTEFNLEAEAGNLTEDSPAELIGGMCSYKLDEAYKKKRKSESCRVLLKIDETGAPLSLKSDCETESYDKAAREAVRCMLFLPPIQDGERLVGPPVLVPVEFKSAD